VNEPSLVTPRLAPGVRLQRDTVRERDVLLYPEGALVLNETATAVLELCDGKRTVDEIAEELGARYGTDVRDDVRKLLDAIAERGLVDGH
jgi:pyrroloquinoline quinone biosynthesis protein D